MDLTARIPEVGESRVRFATDYPYEDLEVGFNPQYLQDGLKVLSGNQVRFELKDSQSPAVLRDLHEVDGALKEIPGFLYVIMPIQLM